MTTRHRALILATTTSVFSALLLGCTGPAPANPAPQPAQQAGASANAAAPGAASPTSRPMKLLDPVPFPRTELDADDQLSDGARVLVEETELPVAGHVAVYNQTGNLLGSAPVQAGAHRGLTITLDPALGKGTHSLLAVLTVDDGDGKFDPAHDAPVRENDDTDHEPEDDSFLCTVG
jgi:hypothetical protein